MGQQLPQNDDNYAFVMLQKTHELSVIIICLNPDS